MNFVQTAHMMHVYNTEWNNVLICINIVKIMSWFWTSFKLLLFSVSKEVTDGSSFTLAMLICCKSPIRIEHLVHHMPQTQTYLMVGTPAGCMEAAEREEGPLSLCVTHLSPSLWGRTAYETVPVTVSACCFPSTATLLCFSELQAVTQRKRHNTHGRDINSLWS